MRKPYISVIINNYNYARFLPEAINSVLNQSYTDYEIIVVDDASTDYSRDVILSYGNKIKSVIRERNGGQGAAFNTGVEASCGELICFLDSDDVFHRNKLARVYKAAENKPEATLIYHQCYNTNIIGEIISEPHPTRLWKGELKKKILRHAESLLPQTSLLTFRRHFIDKVFPLNEWLTRFGGDLPLQVLAGMLGEVVCIPEPLTYYRMHGMNAYGSNDFNQLETTHRFMRRNEMEFYYLNCKLADLGVKDRFYPMRNRYYRGHHFIFKHIGWLAFLPHILLNPNFINWKDKWGYIRFAARKRREFNSVNGSSNHLE